MTIANLFKNLRPYVKPYRVLVIATLLLTLVGSFAAQVNALILRYTVDNITLLLNVEDKMHKGNY
jgi:ABC-type multidrug transport system fused ATPase/permease subunit